MDRARRPARGHARAARAEDAPPASRRARGALADERGAPAGRGPDLHAIFGIDGERAETARSGRSPSSAATAISTATSADARPGRRGRRSRSSPGRLATTCEIEAAEQAAEPARRRARESGGWTASRKPSRRGSSPRFLTDVIVEMELASKRQVDDAIETSRTSGTTPERILLDQGAITPDGLARALAERYGLDHLDLGVFQVDMAAANLVSTTVAKRYQAVPVAFADKRTLLVAMADPSNVLAVDDIAIMTGHEVRVAVAPPDDIAALISRLDRLEDVVGSPSERAATRRTSGEVVALHETSDDAPVVKLVNQIVAPGGRARRLGHPLRARRQGGARALPRSTACCRTSRRCPRRMAAGVVSRMKIMAELDIAEKRLPQDGRIGLVVDGRHVDLRVVTLPSVHGEGIVMRVLDKANVVVDLDKLGMADEPSASASNAPAARPTAPCS